MGKSIRVPALPIEMWRHIINHSDDWRAILTLSMTSHQMRSLVLGSRWEGVRELRWSQDAADKSLLVDLKNRRRASQDFFLASLLPRCRALASLAFTMDELYPFPPHQADADVHGGRRGSGPHATRLLRAIPRSSWLERGGGLTKLVLSEQFAISSEAPRLICSFASTLRHLAVVSCKERAARDNTKLWNAIACCAGLRHLLFGFCKDSGETTSHLVVAAALAGKTELESLSLRGLSLMGPQRLLDALAGIRAPGLRSLSLESMGYTNDLFTAASIGDVGKAAFSSIYTFSLNKCGFIFAPLILSVMNNLKVLEVALVDMSEVVKLALSFLVEYAGSSQDRHVLHLNNDLCSARPSATAAFNVDTLEEDCKLAIRAITKKFKLHFDVSFAEIPHPKPELGPRQAKRFAVSKGRALVYLDTFFLYNFSVATPALPGLGVLC